MKPDEITKAAKLAAVRYAADRYVEKGAMGETHPAATLDGYLACLDAYETGARWGAAQSEEEIARLRKALKEADHALEHTNEFCLCTRNTYGFDYGETHPQKGKPGDGKRWLTPTDLTEGCLTLVRQALSPSTKEEG